MKMNKKAEQKLEERRKLRQKLLTIIRKNGIKFDKATCSYWFIGEANRIRKNQVEIDLADFIYDILNLFNKINNK